MDTFSWATKSPPRPVEELRSPVVQRLRSDELFFRKSFRHVNNDSDPADFLFTFSRNPLLTSPESLFRIYRNALFTSPGIRSVGEDLREEKLLWTMLFGSKSRASAH